MHIRACDCGCTTFLPCWIVRMILAGSRRNDIPKLGHLKVANAAALRGFSGARHRDFMLRRYVTFFLIAALISDSESCM